MSSWFGYAHLPDLMKEAALGRPLQRTRITAFGMSTIESGWRHNILAFASHKLLCSIRKYVSHFHLQNLDTELMDGVLPRQHIVTKRHFLRILHYKGTLKSCCCCHFSWPQKLVFSTAYTNNIAREGNKDATRHATTHPEHSTTTAATTTAVDENNSKRKDQDESGPPT